MVHRLPGNGSNSCSKKCGVCASQFTGVVGEVTTFGNRVTTTKSQEGIEP